MTNDKISNINHQTRFFGNQTNTVPREYLKNFLFDEIPKELFTKGSNQHEQIGIAVSEIRKLRENKKGFYDLDM